MQNSKGSKAASDFILESTSARSPRTPSLSQWQPRLEPRTLIVLRAWLNQEGLQGLQEGPQGILRQPLAAFTQPIILRARLNQAGLQGFFHEATAAFAGS